MLFIKNGIADFIIKKINQGNCGQSKKNELISEIIFIDRILKDAFLKNQKKIIYNYSNILDNIKKIIISMNKERDLLDEK